MTRKCDDVNSLFASILAYFRTNFLQICCHVNIFLHSISFSSKCDSFSLRVTLETLALFSNSYVTFDHELKHGKQIFNTLLLE